MRLPPGCGELSDKVVKPLKCQYGLKQAGREWHLLLVTWLVEKIGMEQCKAEPCVFRKIIKNKVTLMVGVYVDDIIVSGEQDLCDEFFNQLKQRFPVKNLGNSRCTPIARSSVTRTRESSKGIRRRSRKTWFNSTAFPQPRTFRRCRSWARKRW